MVQDKKGRFFGLDLARLMSFVAISFHHFVWVIWYTPHAPAADTNFVWAAIESYSRLLSFSGHTILLLSTFLIARAEEPVSKTLRVIALIAFGWFAFSLFEYREDAIYFWYWDIYPLIIAGLLTSLLFRAISVRAVYFMGAVGFIFTLIPFWEIQTFEQLPLLMKTWVIGDCSLDMADWPLLPWVGFVWIGYALGTAKRRNSELFDQFHTSEKFIWPALLLASVPFLGAFYNITIGSQFGCFSFRQPPQIFWSHFIFVIFFFRLSLVKSVNLTLSEIKLVRWVTGLRLSTRFGLAYLIHYSLIEFEQQFLADVIHRSVAFSLVAVLMILPLTEFLLRLGEASVNRLRSARADTTA